MLHIRLIRLESHTQSELSTAAKALKQRFRASSSSRHQILFEMVGAKCLPCANSTLFSTSPKSYDVPSKFQFINFKFPVQIPSVHTKLTSYSPNSELQPFKVHAADSNPKTYPKSIVCRDCEGNGMILCTQCKGEGINSVDHFNGRFKAGTICWLCRGKREILCGQCNGAGFIGGFMSTFDE